jgi:hypothetical protein
MRRILRVLALTFGIGALLSTAGVSTTPAAPPTPLFKVTLTDDGSCHFTATATWSHTKVTEVDFTWSFGIASWQDKVTSFKGPKAVASFSGGVGDTTRDWSVTADFYSGATHSATESDDDMAACALLL